jgi:hypothetical protein
MLLLVEMIWLPFLCLWLLDNYVVRNVAEFFKMTKALEKLNLTDVVVIPATESPMQHVSLLHSTCRCHGCSFLSLLHPHLHFDTYSIGFFVKKCHENYCLESLIISSFLIILSSCNFIHAIAILPLSGNNRDIWTYFYEEVYSVATFTQ